LNPHPKYFLTVSGFVDPTVSSKIKLSVTANYISNNKSCLIEYDKFAGIRGNRYESERVFVTPNKKGGFLVKIPLDKYKAGYCNWNWGEVFYETSDNMRKEGGVPILTYMKGGHIPYKLKGYSLVRYNTKKHYWETTGVALQTMGHGHVPMQKNYHYKILIQGNKNVSTK